MTGGEGGDLVSAEIAEIEGLMRTDRRAYNGRSDRLRALYETQERGEAPTGGGAAKERAEIERVMRTDRARYNADAAMQARYLALLDAEEAGEAAAPGSAEGDDFSPATLAEWTAEGRNPAEHSAYLRIAAAANDVRHAAGDGRQALDAGFSALPRNVQAAAMLAITDRALFAVPPLGEALLQQVKAFPASARAAKSWGHEAPMRFARARERLFRVAERLDEADFGRLLDWLDGLPEAAHGAVLRRLAA